MKRTITSIFTVLLALVMALSLAACGENNRDGEKRASSFDVSNAIVETPAHICKDAKENQAKVKQNTYIMNCTVGAVAENYFTCAEKAVNTEIRVCLDNKSLVDLNKGEKIAIIGKITKFEEGSGGSIFAVMGKAEKYNGSVPEVDPRKDEIFTGKLIMYSSSSEYKWVVLVDGYKHDILFAEGEDVSKLKIHREVTFSCEYYSGDAFTDAKIISVN